jgi:hypothetical protein
VADVGDQNPVIDLVDFSAVSSSRPRAFPRVASASARAMSLAALTLNSCVRGLHDAGSVGHRSQAALIEDQRLRRNRIRTDDTEPSGWNLDSCVSVR